MNRIALLLIGVVALAGAVTFMAATSGQADEEPAPIYGVKIPANYREWKLIAVTNGWLDHAVGSQWQEHDHHRSARGTFTPKQPQLEKGSAKLYWSDREGMRVMRANLDGTEIETLVDTSQGDLRPGSDPRKLCVGIAVDTDDGKFYWTQKGGDNAGLGRIFRANMQIPQGEWAENRRDIELLYDNLPEPIDLEIDPVNRMLYWTDRGDPPRGNTVNRAPMDPENQNGKEPEILVTHLMEGIGLSLDLKGGRMFFTDFGGSVYSANLDGSNRKTILIAEGNLTGIAYANLPCRYTERLKERRQC